MVYGSFAKWYVAKLRAQPFLVNVGSGLVLMSTGDVLAQRVEIRTSGRNQQHRETEQQRQQQTSIAIVVEESESLPSPSSASMFMEATDAVYRTFREEMTSFGWDKSRTVKMAAWSILFTPFYVGIFKMYDRYLPKKNLPSIAARVGFSFLSSIPINFAFYAYGNAMEHTVEWYEERKEQRALWLEQQQRYQQHADSPSSSSHPKPTTLETVDVPYRFDKLVEKTQQKLEAEFFTTIKTSATFWIPLNFLSFSVIPSHMQPLNLMFFSVFWNCYLSMSQHREVVLDDETKED
jgi:hypothetical protein